MRLGTLRITSELLGDIKEGQKIDPFLRTQLEAIESGRDNSFKVGKLISQSYIEPTENRLPACPNQF